MFGSQTGESDSDDDNGNIWPLCEKIMPTPEMGGSTADGLTRLSSPAGCISIGSAAEAGLVNRDELGRFNRLEEYFKTNTGQSGVPEGSSLGYVDRDGGCAVTSVVSAALATGWSVGESGWKPTAILSVATGTCARSEKGFTVKSFYNDAGSLREAAANMATSAGESQKGEWLPALADLYERKKTGALSGSRYANVDLTSAADVVGLFATDLTHGSEHVGQLGLVLMPSALDRAIRVHSAPAGGDWAFTGHPEDGPEGTIIHIVCHNEHYYPALPRVRLPLLHALPTGAAAELTTVHSGKGAVFTPSGTESVAIVKETSSSGSRASMASGTGSSTGSNTVGQTGISPEVKAPKSTGMPNFDITAPRLIYISRTPFISPAAQLCVERALRERPARVSPV